MLQSLKNEDYTDRELLHIVNDVSDGDGWAATADIQDRLKIDAPDAATEEEKDRHAYRCIATRFSWMKRYRFIERDEDAALWRPTEAGYDLMNGKLTKTVENALGRMSEGDRILVMRALTIDYTRHSAGSIMLRREWEHNVKRRRNNG